MAYKRKTAREMIDSNNKLQIEENVKPRGELKGKMVIPPAKEYEELMVKVSKGKIVTQTELRDYFAQKYHANFCCPLVTGIFVNLVAKASEEDLLADKKIDEIVPYWRTLRSNGELNPKYPGGVEAQASKLKAEGHEIQPNRKGRPKRVKDFNMMIFRY